VKGRKNNIIYFQDNTLRKLLKGLIIQKRKKKKRNIVRKDVLENDFNIREEEQRKRLKYKLFKQNQLKNT
jgi:hypothetical protein